MDISNSASLFEVFLGLNFASSLSNKFSKAISDTIVGKHLITKNISRLELKINELSKLKEKIEGNKDQKESLNKISELENKLESDIEAQKSIQGSRTGYFFNSTYFDDCSFIAAMYSVFVLARIAIEPNLTDYYLSLFVVFGIIVILIQVIFFHIDWKNNNNFSKLPPIISPLIISFLAVGLSHFIVQIILNQETLTPIEKESFIIFILIIPIVHFILYSLPSLFEYAFEFGVHDSSVKEIFREIRKLKKKLNKTETNNDNHRKGN